MNRTFITLLIISAVIVSVSCHGHSDTSVKRIAISRSQDPFSAIDAYGQGIAINSKDIKLHEAYLRRMINFGLIETSVRQAQVLLSLDEDNGLAWAVMSFVNAKQGRMNEAILTMQKARKTLPDDPFVLHTSGQLLGWHDTHQADTSLSDQAILFLEEMRQELSTRDAFVAGYVSAKKAYENKELTVGEETTQANEIETPAATEYTTEEIVSQTEQPKQVVYTTNVYSTDYVYYETYSSLWPYYYCYRPGYGYYRRYWPRRWCFYYRPKPHRRHHRDGHHRKGHRDGDYRRRHDSRRNKTNSSITYRSNNLNIRINTATRHPVRNRLRTRTSSNTHSRNRTLLRRQSPVNRRIHRNNTTLRSRANRSQTLGQRTSVQGIRPNVIRKHTAAQHRQSNVANKRSVLRNTRIRATRQPARIQGSKPIVIRKRASTQRTRSNVRTQRNVLQGVRSNVLRQRSTIKRTQTNLRQRPTVQLRQKSVLRQHSAGAARVRNRSRMTRTPRATVTRRR